MITKFVQIFLQHRILNSSCKRFMETVNAVKRKAVDDADDCNEDDTKRLKQESDDIAVPLPPQPAPAIVKVKYQKYAMYVSFCGKGYYGMQTQQNSGFRTVESDIFNALCKVKLISEEDLKKPSEFSFQRASRTDKDVSALKQLCSLALPRHEHDNLCKLVDTMNVQHLPESVKIWGFVRVTKSFDAKWQSDNRTYSYTCPTFAFAHFDELTQECYRLTEERLKEINALLALLIGTRNFYNFTANRKPGDKSCIRYIMKFECEKPFERDGLEFVTIKVRGQSFMLHQIRKMIGIVLAVIRGLVDKTYIERAFSPEERLDVPKAPAVGLLLEEADLKEFRTRFIDSVIVETEKNEKSMFGWLSTLHLHSYDSVPNGAAAIQSPLYQTKKRLAAEAREAKETEELSNNSTVEDVPKDTT